jgi:hypothetical protein
MNTKFIYFYLFNCPGALMVPGLPTILDQSTSSDNHTSTSSKQSKSLVLKEGNVNNENMSIDKPSTPPPLYPRKQNVDVKKPQTPRHQMSVPTTLPTRAQIVS